MIDQVSLVMMEMRRAELLLLASGGAPEDYL